MANTAPKRKNGAETRCPLQELLTRLGDKWSLLIIHALARAPRNRARFSELRREISGISQRMLTATLRNLERDGILTREVFPVIPPRVEYTLTSLGKDLLHPVQALVGWVEGHWAQIQKSRAAFDQSHEAANGPSNKRG
jgi:DNA-binding HxlR family transcriptional regulator